MNVSGTQASSPLSEALARVGDRWTLMVVEALLAGPKRFSDLAEGIAGIAPNILSSRLKHLEREGLMISHPYSTRPPRLAYELTAAGLELASALQLLANWGGRRSGEAEPPSHSVCGTPMETRWYCPTCARPVEESEASELRFA